MIDSEIASIRHVLATLRSRIRRAWTVRGVAITAAAAFALLVFSFALDYFLDLPLPVRAVHLVLVLVVVGLVARWALIRPLRTVASDADLAQAVEYGSPELRDRLVSALDFESRVGDAAEPESRELMTSVVRDAAGIATRLDARLLVDDRPAHRALAIAGAAAAVLVGVAIAAPDDFRLWVRRGLLLGDIPWPRRTHVRLLDFPAQGPRIVTRGEDLRVLALAEGTVPSEVTLEYEQLADEGPEGSPEPSEDVVYTDTRRMYPVDGESGRFAFDFRSVSSSFRLRVRGGDDQDDLPVYTVVALVPPRVASIHAKVVPPEYSKLPEREVLESGFDALKGSRVEMRLESNMPLSGARLVPLDNTPAAELKLEADRKTMNIAFELGEDRAFHLELTAARGQTNRSEDDVFRVRAVEDRAPDLRVLYPPSRLYRTPNGIVPVKFVAQDDFEVAKVWLAMVANSSPAGSEALFGPDAPAKTPPADPRRVDGYVPLDLPKTFGGDSGRALKPGDVLQLDVKAADGQGNESSSGELTVEILSEDDFLRRLASMQGTYREELANVRRNQQRVRSALEELRRTLGSGALAQNAVDRGRDLQVDQGRVGGDLAIFVKGIQQVFDAYVLDRVGRGPVIESLLPIYHEELAKRSDDVVFPPSLYQRIVEEKRADRLYDDDVLGALLDIMDLGDRGLTKLAPAAYDALADWGADPAHPASKLEIAAKAASELAALLNAIDQKMQRWGELNFLIELARDIRNTQDELSKDPAGTRGLAPK